MTFHNIIVFINVAKAMYLRFHKVVLSCVYHMLFHQVFVELFQFKIYILPQARYKDIIKGDTNHNMSLHIICQVRNGMGVDGI